jgi:hypothetical protein
MGSDPGLGPRISEHLTAAGPGRDVALGRTPSADSSGLRVQIAGFRILNYTRTDASVDIAIRGSNGALGGQVYDLTWEDGDWKVELTPDGQMPTDLVVLPDLTGYILWAGA